MWEAGIAFKEISDWDTFHIQNGRKLYSGSSDIVHYHEIPVFWWNESGLIKLRANSG